MKSCNCAESRLIALWQLQVTDPPILSSDCPGKADIRVLNEPLHLYTGASQ